MSKLNVKEKDPARYEFVQGEMKKMREEYASCITIARLCPFCDSKVEILYQGSHGASAAKCPACGEQVMFPPVVFRFAG